MSGQADATVQSGAGEISGLVVFVTCPDTETARDIAVRAVREHLAACVNLIPHVTSLFWWEGDLQESSEVLCVLKTSTDRWAALVERVVHWHPYETPECLGLSVTCGAPAYLQWITEATRVGQSTVEEQP